MRHNRSRRAHPSRHQFPSVNRYGSKQAHYALVQRAMKLGLDFGGRCTGIKQIGDKIFLTIDKGVGCTRSRVVKEVPPLNARHYVPQAALA